MNRLRTIGVVLVALFTPDVLAQPPAGCRGILFDSDRTRIPPVYRTPDLYLMASDGTRERQLTVAKPGEFSRTPSVSPDGQRVVFYGSREGQGEGLYLMSCADGQVTRMTATGTSSAAAWAPDGRRIAFVAGVAAARTISIIEMVTMQVRTLDGLPRDSSGPSWSPDGKHLSFTSRGAVTWEIFDLEIDTGRVRQLTHTADPDTSSQGSAWSPDGSKIAFDRTRDGNFDIYVMDADGTNVVRLTRDPGVDARPAWSPDGQSIVFHSTRDRPAGVAPGNNLFLDIYVMQADGADVRRLTTNQYFDGHPDWSR